MRAATDEGCFARQFEYSVAAKNDLYVASKGTSGLVNDFGAGIPTRLSLINAKTDSDHMRIGVKQLGFKRIRLDYRFIFRLALHARSFLYAAYSIIAIKTPASARNGHEYSLGFFSYTVFSCTTSGRADAESTARKLTV